MTVRRADGGDARTLAILAAKMWETDAEMLEAEFRSLTGSAEAACFLAEEAGVPAGFAQCQLRHDYVEGTDSSPVGYLEGIYVAEAFRRKGFARALLGACESWARERGCTEFASDCELENRDSLRFHLQMGFAEANRVICFRKDL